MKRFARRVKFGDLELSPLSGGVTASDFSVADPPSISQAPFLRAKSLHIGVEFRQLLLLNFSSAGTKAAASRETEPAP